MKSIIYVLLGKSNTGKSTIFKELIKLTSEDNWIEPLKSYTTRPKRDEDTSANEYVFCDREYYTQLSKEHGVLEHSVYDTAHGYWFYFTRKEDVKPDKRYIKILNPTGYYQLKNTAKETNLFDVVGIEIVCDDKVRLSRIESRNDGTSMAERQRRIKADEKDFAYLKTDYKVENNGDKSAKEIAEYILEEIVEF